MSESSMNYSRYARSYYARNAGSAQRNGANGSVQSRSIDLNAPSLRVGSRERIRVSPASRRCSASGIRVQRTRTSHSAVVRKPRLGKLVVVAAIILAFAAASYVTGNSIDKISPTIGTTGRQGSVSSSSAATTPSSTPQQDWKKGTTPSLYQIDPQWASTPYARGTIGDSGCGPTCLSMVYVRLTGKKDMDPVKMSSFSERMGYVEAGATSWLFMTEGARTLGLRATELPADKTTVKQRIADGQPVIAVVGPGDFTTTGHYIVLCGIDADGRAIIRDPNSEENTKRTWDFERVLGQTRNLWAYSA